MIEKYYIDAAIWRDLHENRSDRFRPLGDWAFELFKKIRKDKGKILYSNLIVDELSIAYEKETIKNLFDDISELLEKVEIKKGQVMEAKKLSKKFKIPFGDALHGILARDNNAIMVTRDHHFEELQDMINVKKPEELI
ncbi:type II toxin-antitoxin system VapC family toxin [Candidatus Woesearchaeota archaeon]|nr:type II toxin-antitoxin system VapC family toxin [Candidatus Woesearchaeota archaeon]MBU3941585.1 PIN domain-containing protein [Nanoarchaeota archaeon]